MIYVRLLWAFFKIGLFSFGGGYAMIPLIQKELEINNWLDPLEFADIVAISQMTPGPIAVNAATYIGVRTAGVMGSVFATIGVSLPSFILIVLIARFLDRFKENYIIDSVLKGIRPVTIGLVGSAVIFFAQMSIIKINITWDKFKLFFSGQLKDFVEDMHISLGALFIFLIILVAVKKFKMHPILAVVCSAILGVLLT